MDISHLQKGNAYSYTDYYLQNSELERSNKYCKESLIWNKAIELIGSNHIIRDVFQHISNCSSRRADSSVYKLHQILIFSKLVVNELEFCSSVWQE